jgi:hypothetical protein
MFFCFFVIRWQAQREQIKHCKIFYLKAQARIWPWLSYMCHIQSEPPGRCRANMAHIGESMPDSGLDCQVKVLKTFWSIPRQAVTWPSLCWYWSVQFSISEQLLRRNVKRFRGGLVCKAHRLVYHLTVGSRVIKKKTRLIDMCITQRWARK